jgi:hypothetical protein
MKRQFLTKIPDNVAVVVPSLAWLGPSPMFVEAPVAGAAFAQTPIVPAAVVDVVVAASAASY